MQSEQYLEGLSQKKSSPKPSGVASSTHNVSVDNDKDYVKTRLGCNPNAYRKVKTPSQIIRNSPLIEKKAAQLKGEADYIYERQLHLNELPKKEK